MVYYRKLEAIQRELRHDNVFDLGNFNCQPGIPTFNDWPILLADNELVFVYVALLPEHTHTHLNHRERTVIRLDHFALSPAIANIVTRVFVGN